MLDPGGAVLLEYICLGLVHAEVLQLQITYSLTNKFSLPITKMLNFYFLPVLLKLFLLIHSVESCTPPTNSSSALIIGDDPPADPATLGYNINHFALVVNDIDAMMDFYGRILGMRHIFTFHPSSEYQITYMGHSHGGKNGTGYQHGDEMLREKTNTEGLIEFLYYKGKNSTVKASTVKANTFGHIGVIVPDIQATQARMQDNGVIILKAVGEDPSTSDGPVARAFGLGGNITRARIAALNGIAPLGFRSFLIVTDPDGNLLEIQPQY